MHQKRRHFQDLAGAAGTDFAAICAQRSDFIRADATEAVTAGNHTKSAVVDTGVVKMQAQGDHALVKRRRSTGVGDAVLDRPRTITLDFDSHDQGDAEVLMPEHRPVLARSLVEEDAADGNKSLGKELQKSR